MKCRSISPMPGALPNLNKHTGNAAQLFWLPCILRYREPQQLIAGQRSADWPLSTVAVDGREYSPRFKRVIVYADQVMAWIYLQVTFFHDIQTNGYLCVLCGFAVKSNNHWNIQKLYVTVIMKLCTKGCGYLLVLVGSLVSIALIRLHCVIYCCRS